MADGQHFEVAKAYVTIVPSMEGSRNTIKSEMGMAVEPAAKEVGEKSGKHIGEGIAKGLKTTAAVIGAAMATVTAGAVATGKAFINAANDVSAMGDTIGDTAAKLGISTKSYQEFDFILQRAGSSIEAMKAPMKTLVNAAANGSDAFKALGMSQEAIAKMSPEELFGETIKALQNVEDKTTRTALASKLLGKGATELGGVFDMTNEEMEQAKQTMYDLGAYMDEDAIAASDKYQDTLLNMKDSLKGLKISMISDFLPGLTSVMDGLSKVFSGKGGTEEIQKGLKSVISNITALAPQFFSIATALVNGVLQGFAPMIPSLVSSIFSFLQTGLLTLVSLIPQLTPVITQGLQGIATALLTCLPVLIQALIDITSQLVLWLSSENNVKTFVDGILQLVSTLAEGLADVLPVLLPAIVNIIGQVADSLTEPKNVKMIVTSVLYIVGAVVVALVKSLPEIGGVIVKTTANALQLLKEFGASILSRIGPWFTETLGKIGLFASNVIAKIATLPSKVIEIGRNLVAGLWKGINEKLQWLKGKIESFGKSIVDKVRSVFQVHSPSKVFAEIGSFLAEGLGVGWSDSLGDVRTDMAKSLNGLTGNMSATVTAQGTAGALTENNTTYNGGAITVNVYGTEGQSVTQLADAVADRLAAMTARKGAVYA